MSDPIVVHGTESRARHSAKTGRIPTSGWLILVKRLKVKLVMKVVVNICINVKCWARIDVAIFITRKGILYFYQKN